MNIPNSLTIARIFFVPLLVALLVQERTVFYWKGSAVSHEIVALVIFWLAAATDLLDGYLARRWKQVTTIGMLLDPIADKLLVSAALISLVQVGAVPGWLVVLLVGREFAVSGLRSIAASEGYTIRASELGKTKTFFQVVAISLLMLAIHHKEYSAWARLSLYIVVVFSLWSAISYFAKFWRKVDVDVKLRGRSELLLAERERRLALIAARRAALLEARKLRADRGAAAEFPGQAADLPPSV